MMSANNYIMVDQANNKVYYGFYDCGKPDLIGQGESLEDAIEIAKKYLQDECYGIVEGGINFVGKAQQKDEELAIGNNEC